MKIFKLKQSICQRFYEIWQQSIDTMNVIKMAKKVFS
ncbi:unnamed protein product [Dracunculus medinensis]|uniref:Uncharacterized protein n=1 Tax=Dracunculus medinensis TaxID=318479 RepID=A0A0N4UM08_DRAME|nr:unnamed protein product [Dracunculus medinensis]